MLRQLTALSFRTQLQNSYFILEYSIVLKPLKIRKELEDRNDEMKSDLMLHTVIQLAQMITVNTASSYNLIKKNSVFNKQKSVSWRKY